MKYLHTMIRVSDPAETLRFFSLLGLREVRRMDNEQGRFTLIFLAAPGDEDAQIELTHNWDVPEEGYGEGRNFGHVAYEVDDVYETCRAADGRAASPSTGRRARAGWRSSGRPTTFRSSCCRRARPCPSPSPGRRCPMWAIGERLARPTVRGAARQPPADRRRADGGRGRGGAGGGGDRGRRGRLAALRDAHARAGARPDRRGPRPRRRARSTAQLLLPSGCPSRSTTAPGARCCGLLRGSRDRGARGRPPPRGGRSTRRCARWSRRCGPSWSASISACPSRPCSTGSGPRGARILGNATTVAEARCARRRGASTRSSRRAGRRAAMPGASSARRRKSRWAWSRWCRRSPTRPACR